MDIDFKNKTPQELADYIKITKVKGKQGELIKIGIPYVDEKGSLCYKNTRMPAEMLPYLITHLEEI